MIARNPDREWWNGRRHRWLARAAHAALPPTSTSTPRRSRKNCGITAERDRDQRRADFGTASYQSDFDRAPSSISAAVLASSVLSCSTPDSVEPSWWRPRLRICGCFEEAVRRGRSASTELVHGDLWLSRASWHQPPPLPLIALCAAIRSTNGFSSRRCGSRNTVSRCRTRDRWFVRLRIWLENALRRRRGNPFRTFVHPPLDDADDRTCGVHAREPPPHAVVVI